MRVVEASITETAPTLVFVKKKAPPELTFHDRLAALRKERSVIEGIVLRNTMKEAERRFSDNGGSSR